MEGKFYKKKYAKRKTVALAVTRRLSFTLLIVTLIFTLCVSLYIVDFNVRTNMLPLATPILKIESEGYGIYKLSLLGKSAIIDFSIIDDCIAFMSNVIRTPSPFERCCFIINGYIKQSLPYNLRQNTNEKTFC